MSESKNIKRNSTRPKTANRAFSQSMHGKKETVSQMKEAVERQQTLQKLSSWEALNAPPANETL